MPTSRRRAPVVQPPAPAPVVEAPPQTGGLFDDDLDAAPMSGASLTTVADVEVIRPGPKTAPSLAQLIVQDPGAFDRWIKQREMMLSRFREVAIRSTKPTDWTLFKDRDEHIVGVPRDSGLVIVRKWFGISVFGHRPRGVNGPEPIIHETEAPSIEGGRPNADKLVKITVADLWADGYSDVTGEAVDGIPFSARSDSFAGRGSRQDLASAARTGVDSKVARILSGLRKVSGEELKACGIDLDKCYKGSGFGSSTDRNATRNAEGGVEEGRAKLWSEILRRTGGDQQAALDVLKDITRFKGEGGREWYARSIDQISKAFALEKAWGALKAHPTFGDAKAGGTREPGTEG